MGVYVTGDTHGYNDFDKLYLFSKLHPELTKDDYVIIAGDFGGVWCQKTVEYDLRRYVDLPFTTLMVDGNHENFPMLYSFPQDIWHGGKVHIIKENIIHLMRGQVFEIAGKTFFSFGGATSIDKFMRKEGLTWWKEEVPNNEEFQEGKTNLSKYDNKIDFIITHSCPEKVLNLPPLKTRSFKLGIYPENRLLNYFFDNVEYSKWFFAHYHIDQEINDKMTAVYNNIIKIV